MSAEKRGRFVHIVSHGPQCLDGVTAAVAISRAAGDAQVIPHFSTNAKINETLLAVQCDPVEADHELWITDISWTDPAVDEHLQRLAARGVRMYWIDHHRTALERYARGDVAVGFTHMILSEAFAASRLTYEYLCERLRQGGQANDELAALQHLVAMADDNDRWLHQVAGSRRLALAVGAMRDHEAYSALLHVDAEVTFTPAMLAAARRAEAGVRRSFEVAESSRVAHTLAESGVELVTAVVDGYTSEVADAWAKTASNTVFAFFDARSLGVSLRRSVDCQVDLSHVAARLGGGGHPAAAGCELSAFREQIAAALHSVVGAAIETEVTTAS